MTSPSLAMLLVIRDEEELLGANLTYHHALSVQRAYVVLDRCTDNSEQIARAFDWVQIIHRDRQPDEQFMSAYQTSVMDDVLQRARADGFDWLLHVDADEFAYGDNRPYLLRQMIKWLGSDAAAMGSLPRMIATVPDHIEQIVLRPKEAVPIRAKTEDPFYNIHYYQTRGVLSRPILDPTTDEVHHIQRWLGHDKGKSILRTSADAVAASAHRWQRPDGSDLPTVEKGFHFHFVVTSSQAWLAKYRKFAEYPSYWEKGTSVSFPKQAWKEASVKMTPDDAKQYFQRWIALPRWRLLPSLLLGRVTYEAVIEQILEQASDNA